MIRVKSVTQEINMNGIEKFKFISLVVDRFEVLNCLGLNLSIKQVEGWKD